MKSLLDDIWAIVLGLFGLAVIFVVFVVLFIAVSWFSPAIAYVVGWIYWGVVAIAMANALAREI